MRLSAEFTFDAAHRILGHPGKCAYLHGHTYHLEVTVWSEDPLAPAIERIQAEAPEKVVRLSGNPTAEILTREAWQAIRLSLPQDVSLERVAIKETPACSSELTRG